MEALGGVFSSGNGMANGTSSRWPGIRLSGDEQRVEPKELRNFRLVVRQVLVERRTRGHAGLLQLNDHQRQAVDEPTKSGQPTSFFRQRKDSEHQAIGAVAQCSAQPEMKVSADLCHGLTN